MRRLTLCSALLLGTALHAQPAVTFDNAIATGRSYRGVLLSHAAWQPAVTVDRGDWTFGIWGNVPLHRAEQKEIDPRLIYSFPLGPTAAHLGYQGYTFPGASGGATTYAHEILAGTDAAIPLTATFPVRLSTTAYYDLRRQSLCVEANLSHTIAFGLIGVPLDLTFSLGGGGVDGRNLTPDAPGPHLRDAYQYAGAGIEAAFRLREHASLTLGITWDAARNAGPFQGKTGNTVATAAIGYTW